MQNQTARQRSIWYDDARQLPCIIDQTALPFEFRVIELANLASVCEAIRTMQVRGAPLIGVTAAYGVVLALREDRSDRNLEAAVMQLLQTRPTAINLQWALQRMQAGLVAIPPHDRPTQALGLAARLCDEDVATNRRIGVAGLALIEQLAIVKAGKDGATSNDAINILTHCNAGALATVDWGTALAPIYMAKEQGIAVHVWVDETRPRNQGASLTAWELGQHGVPYTLISDNSGGHLMQQGMVDLCLVGSDRTIPTGDVCNKVGTYLKALAAWDNQVPFYACLPVSTIDWDASRGAKDIPIEHRDPVEVTHVSGLDARGAPQTVTIAPPGCAALNPAFDVTPARLVTGLVTDYGVIPATPEALVRLKRQVEHVT